MVRYLLVALVLVGATSAEAAKKKVQIITKPDKASVYVGSIEAGEKCLTPCSIDVDGETTVIIDLAGYRPKSDQIVIGRRERAPYKRTYNLVPSVGGLKIDGPAGATVFVDGAEVGKLPYEAEVPAGDRTIQVKLDGKELYLNAIQVTEDEVFSITVERSVAVKEPDLDPDPPDPDPPKVKKSASPPREGSLFALSAALSVGFRDFEYRNVNPDTPRNDLGPETEGGQVLAGAQLELWPGTLAGVRALRGFALIGRFQYGVNSQTVVQENVALGARTFWTSLEVSARQQFVIARKFIAEVGLGYIGDQHQFSGLEPDIAKLPNAFYQSLKIGGRGAIVIGALEPYVAIENRIVMSSGPLGQRFENTGGSDVSGFRGAAGVGVRFGKLVGRIEGSLTRYSWNIVNNGADTDGATDSIQQVSMSFGYAY